MHDDDGTAGQPGQEHRPQEVSVDQDVGDDRGHNRGGDCGGRDRRADMN
jgi:hypothetical protein